ncbi:MAG: hypothetical protein ACI3VS_00610 [Evtepia sp.]
MRRKLSRQRLDQLENLLIVLLACSAIFLMGRTGMFQTLAGSTAGQTGTSVYAGDQGVTLSRGNPVGLMVQTQAGRYGVQYDQAQVDSLYSGGLEQMLLRSLTAMEGTKTTTQEAWQQTITQSGSWVYYDFLFDVSLRGQSGQGESAGRLFLITAQNGRVDSISYYEEESGTYYTGRIKDGGITLPSLLYGLPANDGRFAFELPELADLCPGSTMVLNQAPACPVYTSSSSFADLDETARQSLLEKLDFNARAASVYESADGTVIREGADTLRLQKDGTVLFHGAESGEARYQALSQQAWDLQSKAEELLDKLTADLPGEGSLRCQSIQTLEDGQVELTFVYLLDGAWVQLGEEGWAARFCFRDSCLSSFEIRLRQYEKADQLCAVLPLRQAAAAAGALGQSGKELQLCCRDDGSGQTSTAWVVREPG